MPLLLDYFATTTSFSNKHNNYISTGLDIDMITDLESVGSEIPPDIDPTYEKKVKIFITFPTFSSHPNSMKEKLYMESSVKSEIPPVLLYSPRIPPWFAVPSSKLQGE